MKKPVEGLIRRLIDYAGLFPPSGLPMSEALDTYRGHLGDPEAAMFARFIVPAGRLGELGELVDRWPADGLEISLLGSPEATNEAWLARAGAELATAREFLSSFEAARITALELKLPAEALDSSDVPEAVARCVEGLGALLIEHGFRGLHVFCEARFTGADRAFFDSVVVGLRAQKRCGLKIRCGGLEASQFPDTTEVARALLAARDGGCELKATAGLHHPMRHEDGELGVVRHGFLNLVFAAVFALACELDEEVVVEILEERCADAFSFSKAALHWRDLDAGLEAISSARRQLFAGFGCCSFADPVQDLRALRLLPSPTQA